jgi:hypothetical protein
MPIPKIKAVQESVTASTLIEIPVPASNLIAIPVPALDMSHMDMSQGPIQSVASHRIVNSNPTTQTLGSAFMKHFLSLPRPPPAPIVPPIVPFIVPIIDMSHPILISDSPPRTEVALKMFSIFDKPKPRFWPTKFKGFTFVPTFMSGETLFINDVAVPKVAPWQRPHIPLVSTRMKLPPRPGVHRSMTPYIPKPFPPLNDVGKVISVEIAGVGAAIVEECD